MLKVRRSDHEGIVVFALSGRIEEVHVTDLRDLVAAETELNCVTLDLAEVRLVDREVVRFLGTCEAQGIKLRNCPPYIREWIDTGSDTKHES
jgi:predicted metal-binding protein